MIDYHMYISTYRICVQYAKCKVGAMVKNDYQIQKLLSYQSLILDKKSSIDRNLKDFLKLICRDREAIENVIHIAHKNRHQ